MNSKNKIGLDNNRTTKIPPCGAINWISKAPTSAPVRAEPTIKLGIAQANAWTALEEAGLGANLQHYNPVIDDAVAAEWSIPENWQLRAQLVFGSKESEPNEKEFLSDDERFRVFH